MTREVNVIAWCDGCASEVADGSGAVERATHVLTLTARLDTRTAQPRQLDLCERHLKALWGPLSDLIEQYGVRPDDAPAVRRRDGVRDPSHGTTFGKGIAGPWFCLCGQERGTGAELTRHLKDDHKVKSATITAVYGVRCPLDGETLKLLGPHVKRAHRELPNTTAAFPAAEQLGDPHKVVSRQRRALGIR